MADASRGSPGARRIGGTLELSFKEIASVQGIVKAVAELQLASWTWSFNRLSVGMASDIAAAGCEGLLKLYLHGNAVESLGEVVALAETCPSLRALSLHGCPVREHPAYRPFLVATFPNLVTLDFTPVTPAERDAAVSWRKMTKVKVPPVAPPPS
ncbi:hypothetical protein FNF28_07837 [Cafeteria roenbergensis]|uniref:Uncharacterized protein n=1 Tax=Cafeteria roenbergensis TaxID=33653 RepID=A0A5A8C0P9_CAFRO|nr:hypothetical protein FNF28_07837 [Cafeteria roenbergensis]